MNNLLWYLGKQLILEVVMWQQWVNLILGIWLIILPWLGLSYSSFQIWVLIVGIIIAILALWGALARKNT